MDETVVLFDPSAELDGELCELSIVRLADGRVRVTVARDDDEHLEVITEQRLSLPVPSEVAA